MEYNERQVSERWLTQKFEQKLSDIEAKLVHQILTTAKRTVNKT